MKKEFDEATLAESSVSLRLVDIRRRCSQLLDDPTELDGLALEEPVIPLDNSNPYNRG